MAIVTQEAVIDGSTFTVSQLPARRALLLSLRLGKVLGDPVMRVLQSAMHAETKGKPGIAGAMAALGDMDVESLGPAVTGLFERMSEQDLEWLLKELLHNTLIDGAPLWPQFDIAMQGRLRTVFKLLWFALRVQFQDFSDGRQDSKPAMQQVGMSGPSRYGT